MQRIKRLSTIFIWYGLTFYTLLTIALTDYAMMDSHYINVGLLWIATVSFFLGQSVGQLTTFLMLVIGFFGRGTLVVYVSSFEMFGLTVYWQYLPLLIFFVVINRRELPDWFTTAFKDRPADKK